MSMNIADLFAAAGLSARGPIPWGADVTEKAAGVYVVSLGSGSTGQTHLVDLPVRQVLPDGLKVDWEYERTRWLRGEEIVYIGKSDRAIQTRLKEFFRHKLGNPSPHAGGQILKLLQCELQIYWSPAEHPYEAEQTMIRAFVKEAGKAPFGNEAKDRTARRVQLLS